MNVIADAQVSRRYWWIIGLRGLLAVLFGLAAFFWTGLTLLALVYLFGAYALVSGVMMVIVSLEGRKYYRQWWVLLIEGLVGIAAGVVAFAWPFITALALLYLIAAWAIVTGVFEIAASFSGLLPMAQEWTLALAGIRRAPGRSTWSRNLGPGVVDRGLCPGLRHSAHHPCLPVQNSRYDSRYCLNAGKAHLQCFTSPHLN